MKWLFRFHWVLTYKYFVNVCMVCFCFICNSSGGMGDLRGEETESKTNRGILRVKYMQRLDKYNQCCKWSIFANKGVSSVYYLTFSTKMFFFQNLVVMWTKLNFEYWKDRHVTPLKSCNFSFARHVSRYNEMNDGSIWMNTRTLLSNHCMVDVNSRCARGTTEISLWPTGGEKRKRKTNIYTSNLCDEDKQCL